MPVFLVAVDPSFLASHKQKITFSKAPNKDYWEQVRHNLDVLKTSVLLSLSTMPSPENYSAISFAGGNPDLDFMSMGSRLLNTLSNSTGYTGNEDGALTKVIEPFSIIRTIPYHPGETSELITPPEASEAYQIALSHSALLTPLKIVVYVDSNTTADEARKNGITEGVLFESVLDAKNHAKYKDYNFKQEIEKIQDSIRSMDENIIEIDKKIAELEEKERSLENTSFSEEEGEIITKKEESAFDHSRDRFFKEGEKESEESEVIPSKDQKL